MLLLTNGQPFYWNNPTTPVFLPADEVANIQIDDRIYRLERILNTFPGRIMRKVYRGMRKIKHFVKK